MAWGNGPENEWPDGNAERHGARGSEQLVAGIAGGRGLLIRRRTVEWGQGKINGGAK